MTDKDRSLLFRCLVGLAIVGAAVVLGGIFLSAIWLSAFLRKNGLSLKTRHLVLAQQGMGALVAVAIGFVVWFRRRRSDGLVRLSALARFVAPLVLLALVPGLVAPGAWEDTLVLALTIAAFLLALEPLVRLHLESYADLPVLLPFLPRVVGWVRGRLVALRARTGPAPVAIGRFFERWGPLLFVVLCAAGYAAYASFYTVRNHWRFNTFNYDLGQVDNLFYNALKGHPMRCTPLIREGNWSELRNHAEFSIYGLMPFYALAPRSETLLIMQSTLIGSAAIPLYRFAARRLPRLIAVCLALSYLFYPPLHGANFFDFHFQPVAAVFVLWTIDAFDERRWYLFAPFYLLAIGCREDVSVGLTIFGIFLMVTGHRVRQGALIALVSATYFVVMRFFVMPSFGGWGFHHIYKDLFPKGDESFAGVVKTLLSNPLFSFKTLLTADKLRYALQILAPIAFLPLRRPYLWLALVPGFVVTLMTTSYGPTTEINFQYSGLFIGYIFPAAALALAAYGVDPQQRRRRTAAVVVLVMGTLLTTWHWGAIPPRLQFRSGYAYVHFGPLSQVDVERRRYLHELAALVPPDVSLAVTDRELPHLSNRTECYCLTDGYEGSDYILHIPNAGGRDGEQAAAALASGKYEEVATRPGFSLLKRKGAKGPVTPAAGK